MTLRIIKKYPNRRLYDTQLGKYITLEEIKTFVLDRVEFQVIDARTQKDLTQSTLLQIIAEQEAHSTPLFTTNVLQDFIRLYHEKSHSFLSGYLEEALKLFTQQKSFYQNQWETYQNLLLDPNFAKRILEMQKTWAENLTKNKKQK